MWLGALLEKAPLNTLYPLFSSSTQVFSARLFSKLDSLGPGGRKVSSPGNPPPNQAHSCGTLKALTC